MKIGPFKVQIHEKRQTEHNRRESDRLFSTRYQVLEVLEQDRKYVIARQLLRSGTSIGANVFEAQDAESRNDFIHKMKIAAKEASETQYWLTLCERSDSYRSDKSVKEKLDEIILILSRIISSSKNRTY